MRKLKNILILFITAIFTFSCTDDLPIDNPYLGEYQNGYFITNEGPFNTGSGTLTYISDDGNIVQNVYQTVNNEDLGNIVQSMTFHNDKAYIVVNNSHKIIVANRHTMKKITVIEGENINNPRYFVAIGNKGYVSNWNNANDASDDYIAVIDLSTNVVTNTISVGEGPEDMLIANNKVYVNLQGGWHQNDKVEIIDINSDSIISTLTVGNIPNSLIKDTDNNIWVLCGNPYGNTETNGSLIKIIDDQIESTINFEISEHPNHLTISNNKLYYNLNGKVYSMLNSATELNTNSIENFDGYYYAMKAHNNKLYATNANDFTSEGTLKVFDLNTNTLNKTITTGIIPGDIAF